MKLLCLNVCQFDKNNERLEKFLNENSYDIVCLQEVTRRIEIGAIQEFVSYDSISKSTDYMESPFFAPIWALKRFYKENFHGQELFDHNMQGYVEFGNYIRSTLEISYGQNIFLQGNYVMRTDWSEWPEVDSRAVQVVDLLIKGAPGLRILNYHGIWTKDKMGNETTVNACKRISEIAAEVEYPSIICGDFNLFPDTESMRVFEDKYVNLMNKFDIRTTRPDSNAFKDNKRNVVDYVLCSKGLQVNDLTVIESDVSDHLPVVVDFELEYPNE